MSVLLKFTWCSILWIRQFIFIVYILGLTVIFSIITISFSFLKVPVKIRIFLVRMWSVLARYGIFLILWLRIKTEGKINYLSKPCIYICKHQSSWETLVFHGLLGNVCFVLKEELIKVPLLGKGLEAIYSIPIDRQASLKSFKQVLKIGQKRLQSGLNIVIFPEGKRVPVGRYPKFYRAAIVLAKVSGVMIIPIAHNSGKFWPRKMGLIKPGTIMLSSGKAIVPNKFNVEELNEYCYTWINNKVKSMGG